jgi:hypothetical protein
LPRHVWPLKEQTADRLSGLWGNQKGSAATAVRSADVYRYYAFVPLVKSKDGKSRSITAYLEALAYITAGMNWNGATASKVAITATDVSYSNQLPGGSANKGYGAYDQIIFYPIEDLGITAGYARRKP